MFAVIFVVMFVVAVAGAVRWHPGCVHASDDGRPQRHAVLRFRRGGGVPVGSRPREHSGVPPPSVPPGTGSVGDRAGAAGLAAGGARRLRGDPAAGLPRGRDPRCRQDDVRLRVAADLLARRVVEAITVVAPTEHLKRQWSEAAHRAGIALDPEFSNGQGALGAGLRRRGGDLRAGRGPPAAAPAPHGAAAHPRRARRGAPRRRRADLGRGGRGGVRPGHPAAVADGHAVPQSDINPIPFVELRPGRRRGAAVGRGPPLRLRRGAARRGRPAGDLPGVHRADAMAYACRRRGRGLAGRAA